jgi:hypothetical protein
MREQQAFLIYLRIDGGGGGGMAQSTQAGNFRVTFPFLLKQTHTQTNSQRAQKEERKRHQRRLN